MRGWEAPSNPYLKGEGVGVLTKLLQQLLLQRGEGFGHLLRHRWEDLSGQDVEVLPEGQSNDIQVISAVAKGARECHIDWGQRG